MTTFADILGRRLRDRPGQPLLTFYDGATGERTELSVTTYANWVAKTASLLAEELSLDRGSQVCVDLPVHWLGPVFAGAAWMIGARVTSRPVADAYVCGPDALPSRVGAEPTLACSLLPLAARFAAPLPAGVLDFGVEVWGQPDVFVPWDPPTLDDPATDGRRQRDLFRAPGTHGPRILSQLPTISPDGLDQLVTALVTGGSLVLLANGDPDRIPRLCAEERITDDSGGPSNVQ